MTSLEIRNSYLEFFKNKQHSIVSSASLMPTSPNLLFTNAGMNQFVPYFLGETKSPFARAADTQKCIRAGGKHNDLEDVGFDTYHHTFFEMLGNWSFGDYFKKEAIEWAWELLVSVWKFPKERLYATVYMPEEGEPASFDNEAYDIWYNIFTKEGLDPKVHIINGNKKDNFWMMGETGPCGPCSELHIDLTEKGNTKGSLVNKDSPKCIEIWNLVFIQFNAEVNGDFIPLKSKHVDTGMGLERVAGIMASTKNFTDFSVFSSNYNSDLFTDLFSHISAMSGKAYKGTIPEHRDDMSAQELNDCVFRVLADHIRTLSFSIADGILPGNEGRNYVLRRILRRAVMYSKRISLPAGSFTKLAVPLIDKMSPIFPELQEQKKLIVNIIDNEEKSFERTLDRGLALLDNFTENQSEITGEQAFILYDTYGFPLDLTELIARERSMKVDTEGFEVAMEKQRQLARNAQKKSIISVSDTKQLLHTTQFVGYRQSNLSDFKTTISAIIEAEDCDYLIFPQTPFYAEKGGQIADTGFVELEDNAREIFDTKIDSAGHILHKVRKSAFSSADIGKDIILNVDRQKRYAIQRHHTATHLLHWALRRVLGTHVRQAGSYVDDQRLRFDFSHYEAPTKEQLREVENLVNAKILENEAVKWYEIPYKEIPENCIAFFGEKYGLIVRVVETGSFHSELCGGTHAGSLGELGLVKIRSECAIAAGTRRLEAVAGSVALSYFEELQDSINAISQSLSSKADKVEEAVTKLIEQKTSLEHSIKEMKNAQSGDLAKELASKAVAEDGLNYLKLIVDANPNDMREIAVKLSKEIQDFVIILACANGEKANILATLSPAAIAKGLKAGDIVRELCTKIGGKGGGKPDFAMGAGKSELLKEIF
ncbi:MAG: alanine--tRNA ligase [Opitutales bacterium]